VGFASVEKVDRNQMVQEQLAERGIADPRVLDAFRAIPREAFVPDELAPYAYADAPLPIGGGQTISQPYVVALMLEALALTGHERVLEIGTGSGYSAALLGRLAQEVFTVERLAPLAHTAEAHLERAGARNVHVRVGDGTLGWPEHAPYDGVVVAAGAPELPRALVDQLAPNGRLVIPVGANDSQVLVRATRDQSGRVHSKRMAWVRFVPLIGAGGWPENHDDDIDPLIPHSAFDQGRTP
jgi:protein-L-isoaspartate(D-aspartate) O-methyltransferase